MAKSIDVSTLGMRQGKKMPSKGASKRLAVAISSIQGMVAGFEQISDGAGVVIIHFGPGTKLESVRSITGRPQVVLTRSGEVEQLNDWLALWAKETFSKLLGEIKAEDVRSAPKRRRGNKS